MWSAYKVAEFYKGLFEGLKYIQNIRNKGIYINDYYDNNFDYKNVAADWFIPNFTSPHFKFNLTRIFGKLALVILSMNKYGIDSLEFSELKATDNFINEISGKKFEIVNEDRNSLIVLDEKYKLNLKKIDYQKNHKEILKSFEHFDITTVDQLRSVFYSFELE